MEDTKGAEALARLKSVTARVGCPPVQVDTRITMDSQCRLTSSAAPLVIHNTPTISFSTTFLHIDTRISRHHNHHFSLHCDVEKLTNKFKDHQSCLLN